MELIHTDRRRETCTPVTISRLNGSKITIPLTLRTRESNTKLGKTFRRHNCWKEYGGSAVDLGGQVTILTELPLFLASIKAITKSLKRKAKAHKGLIHPSCVLCVSTSEDFPSRRMTGDVIQETHSLNATASSRC
jgi:hypothetical protein